jgi:hypothetical protein
MSKENTGVIIMSNHEEAETAVKELQRSGFDMKKLSIVGKDYHTEENVIGYYNAGDRMSFWGKQGAFWGGMWGILIGSAFFMVPGIGPLLIAGPLVAVIVGGLQGAVMIGGVSVIGAALFSIGIPKDSILSYETAIKSERFIIVLHGTAEELANAKDILATMGHDVQLHSV